MLCQLGKEGPVSIWRGPGAQPQVLQSRRTWENTEVICLSWVVFSISPLQKDTEAVGIQPSCHVQCGEVFQGQGQVQDVLLNGSVHVQGEGVQVGAGSKDWGQGQGGP